MFPLEGCLVGGVNKLQPLKPHCGPSLSLLAMRTRPQTLHFGEVKVHEGDVGDDEPAQVLNSDPSSDARRLCVVSGAANNQRILWEKINFG